MGRFITLNVYLVLVGAAFALSGIAQIFMQEFLASSGTWELAPGWQREIAIWNVALLATIVVTLITQSRARTYLVGQVTLLTLILGVNHLYSLRTDTDLPWWHIILALANLIGFAFGCMILYKFVIRE